MVRFWLDDPLVLFQDLNVLPTESQSYPDRMNTLTRLILVIAVIMFLLSVKGSGYFLVFGLVLVIILYYTQRQMNPVAQFDPPGLFADRPAAAPVEHPGHLSPQGNIPSIESPDLGGVLYTHLNGPPHARYRNPIEVPFAAGDAKAWGGYFPQINESQPVFLGDTNYESTQWASGPLQSSGRVEWNPPQGAPPRQQPFAIPQGTQVHQGVEYPYKGMSGLVPLSPEPSILDQSGLDAVYLPPPSGVTLLSQPSPQSQIPGYRAGAPPGAERNPNSVLSLGVDGVDDRFQAGNDHYIYHRSVHDPNIHQDFVQPLNANSGLMPDHPDRHSRYDSIRDLPPSYDPRHASAHLLRYRDMDGYEPDLGPYRSKPTLQDPYAPQRESYGDGYRAFTDLHGNNQYYYTRVDPFPSGMFITRSSVDHMDHMTVDGAIIPRYERDGVTERDFMDVVADRQTADELYFRDSMLGDIQAKINERDAQLRMAPLSMTPLARPSHRHKR